TLMLSAPEEPMLPPADVTLRDGAVTVPEGLLLILPTAASETLVVPVIAPAMARDPVVAVKSTVAALTEPGAEPVRLFEAVTEKLASADEAPEMLVESAASWIDTMPAAALALKFATFILSRAKKPMLPAVDVRLSVGVLSVAKAPLSILPPAVSETLFDAVMV